jgi:hypothetical protein
MVEWMLASSEHRHTVFTDRINVPCMDPIDGTLKLHMVSGTWNCGEQLVMVLGNDELRQQKCENIQAEGSQYALCLYRM